MVNPARRFPQSVVRRRARMTHFKPSVSVPVSVVGFAVKQPPPMSCLPKTFFALPIVSSLILQSALVFSMTVAVSAQEAPFARIDLSGFHPSGYGRIMLLNSRTMVSVRRMAPHDKDSVIDFWDLRSGRIVQSIHSSVPLDPDNAVLTLSGKFLAVAEDGLEGRDGYARKVLFWDMTARKLRRTVDYGKDFIVNGLVHSPGVSNQVIVTVFPLPLEP